MGARLKKFAFILALAFTITGGSAHAATKSPSAKPSPTVKISSNATVKATVKATIKGSAAATSKATSKATSSSKTTVKPTTTSKATSSTSSKPVVKPKPKPKPRKKIKVTPSPKPKWPPVGFEYATGVYAKIPTSKELVGVISAKGNLASQVEACSKFICGAVQVAAEPGCLWWEVNSHLFSKEKVLLGSLRTISGSSEARDVKTILLISPESLDSLEYISDIEVVCHQEQKPENTASVTYTKVVSD